MADDANKFDDPRLKAAIRQLRSGRRAPAELRQRIARQLAERTNWPKTPTTPMVKFIAAMAAVITVTFLGYIIYSQLYPSRPAYHAYPVDYPVDDKLLSAMVASHKSTQNMGCTTLSASLSDPAALAAEASDKLHRPVPTVQLPGWTIDAATICTFEQVQGARFHLTRDGKNLTVVSVPAAAYGAYASGNYQKIVDGYPIAGTVMRPSLNCVVADATVDLNEVAELRDQILKPQKP